MKTSWITRTLAIAGLFACSYASAADEIPLRDFARHATVSSPRLSPDGQYLSIRIKTEDGQNALSVLRISDMQTASLLKMPRRELPLQTSWVSDTRLVIAKGREYGSLDEPQLTGEIFATEFDGSQQKYLFGWASGKKRRQHARDYGVGFLAGLPEVRNGHVYIRDEPFGKSRKSRIYDVDTTNEGRRTIAEIGEPGMFFTLDHEGKARYAYGQTEDLDYVVYGRNDNDWVKLDLATIGDITPTAFMPDNRRIFAYYSEHDGPAQLVVQDPDGANRLTLAKDTVFSPSYLLWEAAVGIPYAVAYVDDAPRYIYVNTASAAASVHKAMVEKFPGQDVDLLSISTDNQRVLLSVSSDTNPGSYYLLDLGQKSLRKLFDAEPWIKPEQMSKRQQFHFTASDGVEIFGYLTIPLGREAKNLPMVLLPHGGPHGVSDSWYFDSDAQMLASRGYAVLQVNFRSSGGRGVEFKEAGYRKWGTRVQQDLIEGTRWAVAEGIADKSRICTFGASFGGYSALMAPIRAPGLFQCAIAYAGIYDLALMYDKGDIKKRDAGVNYLNLAIGTDETELSANSPAKHAAEIKVPVFLVHGEDDERAPFAHAKLMRSALEAVDNKPEWMAVADEGHGFYDEDNNVELYTRMLAFLNKHIGAGAAAAK